MRKTVPPCGCLVVLLLAIAACSGTHRRESCICIKMGDRTAPTHMMLTGALGTLVKYPDCMGTAAIDPVTPALRRFQAGHDLSELDEETIRTYRRLGVIGKSGHLCVKVLEPGEYILSVKLAGRSGYYQTVVNVPPEKDPAEFELSLESFRHVKKADPFVPMADELEGVPSRSR